MTDLFTVATTSGKVCGAADGGVYSFKGIPYAAPPVGPLRFLPPAAPAPWSGVRDAFDYGPSCPQLPDRPAGWSQEPALSEDCLYLNVWTPGLDDHVQRPVLVWLHGGGFAIGSGSWPVYDGTALARRGAVVVTVNHRLGIFGYFHLAGLAGPEFASAGNAGMLDLVAALEWVRDNVRFFGGDPANVTIFGESGGGAKVSILHAMPAARGLFHRAAVQSGPGLRVRTPEQAVETSERVLSGLGSAAGPAEALQTMPAERLLEVQAKLGRRSVFAFSPVLDGIHVTAHPRDAFAGGDAPDLPMLIGCNRDEATLFLARDPGVGDGALDEDGLRARLRSLGDDADAILAAYRRARPAATPRELLVAVESDRMMRIPSIELAEARLKGGRAPVYMYLFCWAAGPLGSAHGFEIPFVFDNARPPVMPESPGRQLLAEKMSESWLAFARHDSPQHSYLPAWPPYSLAERCTMIFDRGRCHVVNDPGSEERAAWQSARVPTGMAPA